MVQRVVETVKDVGLIEYRYLPGRALLSFVRTIKKLEKLPQNDKNVVYGHMAKYMDGVL
jgi:hypothetical protein